MERNKKCKKIMRIRSILILFFFLTVFLINAQTPREEKAFWKKISKEVPEFKRIFKKHKKYRFEIIYGQVNHEPGKAPHINKYYFGDPTQYFYPASTVKLPIALKACQCINKLQESNEITTGEWYLQFDDSAFCGGNKYQTRSHHFLRVNNAIRSSKAAALCGLNAEEFLNLNHIDPDTTIEKGHIIFASNAKKPISLNELMCEMLLYSNNNYYNQLFDLANGENCEFNNKIKITTRFLPCLGDDIDQTIPSYLINDRTLQTYRMEREKISDKRKNLFGSGYKVGKGIMKDTLLVKEPKNFTNHNAIQLETLQNSLIELIYSGYLPDGSFYDINEEQRKLLIRFLGMKPSEDKIVTDSTYLRLPDDNTNFLFTGQKHEALPASIRIINIVGMAYGFITDCMYFVDEKNKIDFFLAARIYVNKDNILNDDKYEYEEIAYPLFEQLGKRIYEYEKTRTKVYATNPGWLFEIFR
jgi:hypothetical protein